MNLLNDCEVITDERWELLVAQNVENYGIYILNETFDFDSYRLKKKIPEEQRSLIREFRNEYFRRIEL